MNYFVFLPSWPDDCAVISAPPDNGPKAYKYSDGLPLLEQFPPQHDAIVCLDPNYPDRVKKYDILPVLGGLMAVNTKTKNLIKQWQRSNLEFLPITIWDHQKKPFSEDYFIVNPLKAEPLIDMEKSTYRMNPLNENQISRIKNLVTTKDCVSAESKLFRAKDKLDQFFVDSELAQALTENQITGYKVIEAENWNGLDI